VGGVVRGRPRHAEPAVITMACGRGGYVGAAPLGHGEWTLAAALDPGLVRDAGPAGAIAAVLEECGLHEPVLDRQGIKGVGHLTRRRRRLAQGRVVVVGDAVGYVEPLTGEGMSWAIACAAEVGPFAERAAAGEDVARAWGAACARMLRARRLVCRGVCALARRPRALSLVLRSGSFMPVAGWASRRLCWRSA
jgi:2-polyprenyl-6-methoxyphenol hydroxylase-like FAD-dependent oxidoreductase